MSWEEKSCVFVKKQIYDEDIMILWGKYESIIHTEKNYSLHLLKQIKISGCKTFIWTTF